MSTYSTALRGKEVRARAVRLSPAVNRIVDGIIASEPYWVIPLLPVIFVQTPCSWLALSCAILPWPLRFLRHGYLTRHSTFDPAIVCLLLGIALGSLVAPDHRLGIEALESYLAGVIAYYLFVNHPGHVKLYVVCLFLGAIGGILWVFSQGSVGLNKTTSFNHWAYDLATPLPKLTNQPAYPNGLAGLLVVASPMAWGLACYTSSKQQRWAAGSLAAFLSLAILLSGSRGGIIGLTLALIFVCSWRTRWSLLLLPPLTCVVIAISLGGLPALDRLWDNPWASTAGGRLVIWESTLQTLPGRLVTGLGPGGSALVYPRYAPPWLSDFATNPHNAFLQLWSDAGVLGALAGLYALVAGLRLALLVRRLPRENTRFGLAIGLLGAVVGAAVHGTFESAISAVVTDPSGTYHYIVSPLPWYVAGLLWIVLSPLPRRAASDS